MKGLLLGLAYLMFISFFFFRKISLAITYTASFCLETNLSISYN
jgi:hypothetical protein